MISFTKRNGLSIHDEYLTLLTEQGLDNFGRLMNYDEGTILKSKDRRTIMKIMIGNRFFYLKKYTSRFPSARTLIPWKKPEDIKNEWDNILQMIDLGFNTATPVAFGERKKQGSIRMLMLTEEIPEAEKLESFIPRFYAGRLDPGRLADKRQLIRKTAFLAREMHSHGLNHQDFYLGHLFLRAHDSEIFILDLQRMHRSATVSRQAIVKDLAQLLYSAEETGVLTRSDYIRFAHEYFGKKSLGKPERALISMVMRKKDKIARHDTKLKKKKKSVCI